jgi:hypothetical protein
MNIPEQEKVLKEKIDTYNKIANSLIANIGMAKIIDGFSIKIKHRKELSLKASKLSVVDLLTTLEEIYDEYTYLNELYREEPK